MQIIANQIRNEIRSCKSLGIKRTPHHAINGRIDLLVHGNFKDRKDVESSSKTLMYWSNPKRYLDYTY
jgi:hypothetical protein